MMSWYRLGQLLCTPVVHAACRLQVVGKENIPPSGPFILVGNHQSYLDPIIVQIACRRPLHAFTKSTQFSGRFMGWALPRINAIPTRRYRIDPQVVRSALRVLARGECVGIYPEGERSWDATLQPFRRGTIRLILKAGVPVVPCGLAGSYDVLPRWSGKILRRDVRLEFGVPLLWPAMDRRSEREAALPEATERLRTALASLSGWEGLSNTGGQPRAQRDRSEEEGPEWLKADLP